MGLGWHGAGAGLVVLAVDAEVANGGHGALEQVRPQPRLLHHVHKHLRIPDGTEYIIYIYIYIYIICTRTPAHQRAGAGVCAAGQRAGSCAQYRRPDASGATRPRSASLNDPPSLSFTTRLAREPTRYAA